MANPFAMAVQAAVAQKKGKGGKKPPPQIGKKPKK